MRSVASWRGGCGPLSSSQREARRSRVILLCADGVPLRQINEIVGIDQHQVGLWRRRFLEHRLDGLWTCRGLVGRGGSVKTNG